MKIIKPTNEQLDTLETVASGATVKVTAYAGAGKTSTLGMIAERFSTKRGQYLAFNKGIAAEAKRKFPPTSCARQSIRSPSGPPTRR